MEFFSKSQKMKLIFLCFRYFVLELCAASLGDYIQGKYQGPMPTDEQVLFQLASGLEYIHSEGILYRGVTPQNVLISSTKPVQMKYCDFGLSKSVNERGTCSLSGVKGTAVYWMSPEEWKMMMNENKILRGSVKSDIFSAGCLFIYFLLRGKHPFGKERNEITYNIMTYNPVNEKG
jgi:serine/threonine-protein kinase/endoribonuclease IRE1